jgi:hypothetical protein
MRRLAPFVLALGLTNSPIISHPARAQNANEQAAPEDGAAGKGQGRPLDGYIGTAVLLLLALFIVGKSARR